MAELARQPLRSARQLSSVIAFLGFLAVVRLGRARKLQDWGTLLKRLFYPYKAWPPEPVELLASWRQVLGSALLFVLALVAAHRRSEAQDRASGLEEECDRHAAAETARRRAALQEILRSACTAVPRLGSQLRLQGSSLCKCLRHLGALEGSGPEAAMQVRAVAQDLLASVGGGNDACQEEGDESTGAVSAEDVMDAAERLARCGFEDDLPLLGYAIAAQLFSDELQKSRKEVLAGTALIDDLRQRSEQAEELAEKVRLWRGISPFRAFSATPVARFQCAQEVLRVLATAQRAAWNEIASRRRMQLAKTLVFLGRFRGEGACLGLASALAVPCGAFAAARLHYQSLALDAARIALTARTGGDIGGGIAGRPKVGEAIAALLFGEVLSMLAELGRQQLGAIGKQRAVRQLKGDLFESLLSQDLEYLEKSDLHELRHLIGNCGTMVGTLLDFPANFIEGVARIGAAGALLWGKSRRLSLLLAALLPMQLGLAGVLQRVADALENIGALPDLRGQVNAIWGALVRPSEFRTLRAFAREPLEVRGFRHFLLLQDRLAFRGALLYRVFDPLQTLLERAVETCALWYGGHLAAGGMMSLGDLSAFVLMAQTAFNQVRHLSISAACVCTQALGPIEQMEALLQRHPRIGLREPPLSTMPLASSMRWHVTFEGVTFAYPSRPTVRVLDGLSFEARPGELLGILGETGAGKSSIFALLLRFYDPDAGRITIDGRDLRDYNPLWLRQQLGLVTQEVMLSGRTVKDSLLYGCSEGQEASRQDAKLGDAPAGPSDEEIFRVLEAAQLKDTFTDPQRFPHGWHTAVGDAGSELSGGQKQRLALARALLKRPRVLLLDEATSALDERSQARVLEAVESLRQQEGATVITIAHRLSNFRHANRILVLKEGRKAEEGTWDELLKNPASVLSEYVRIQEESLRSKAGTEAEICAEASTMPA